MKKSFFVGIGVCSLALIALFMLTLGVFMLLCAIAINGGIAVRLVCGGLAALCLGYLVFFISRVWLSMR